MVGSYLGLIIADATVVVLLCPKRGKKTGTYEQHGFGLKRSRDDFGPVLEPSRAQTKGKNQSTKCFQKKMISTPGDT